MASGEIDYSPPRKKQRMSSPTYDMDEITGSDFDILDEIETQLSQKMLSLQQRNQSDEECARRLRNITEALASGVDETDGRAKGREAEDAPSQSHLSAPIASIGAHTGTMNGAQTTTTPLLGFVPSRCLSRNAPCDIPSSSPEAPSERDYAAWFQSDSNSSMNAGFTSANLLLQKDSGDRDDESASNIVEDTMPQSVSVPEAAIVPVLGFTSAGSVSRADTSSHETFSVGFQSARSVEKLLSAPDELDTSVLSGFTSAKAAIDPDSRSEPFPVLLASTKGEDKFALSSEALRRAAERMKQWEEEDEIENEFGNDPLDTPTRPSRSVQKPAAAPKDVSLPACRVPAFSTPPVTSASRLPKPKAFKSPLIAKNPQKSVYPSSNIPRYTNSLLNPNNNRKPLAAFNNASTAFATPASPSAKLAPPAPLLGTLAALSAPRKSLGVTQRRGTALSTPLKKFVTPFKPGLRPGDPGRVQLEQEIAKKAVFAAPKVPISPIRGRSSRVVVKSKWFDMTPVPDRQTLLSSGFVPQSYTRAELQAMGINISELNQITPISAMYYAFNTEFSISPGASHVSGSSSSLGPQNMLEQLHAKGCCLATQEWVENHWSLILWKLAGMVCLDPKSESDSRTRRWCWGHILEQFLYRYEKELECGSRPPLRLIATQDTPASLPMVLCVSNITWSSGGADDDGLVTDPIPELELTDGWYKLRAEADGTLTRAIRKGKIRVGRKIGVQNARLSSDHKDPTEVLEAYDRCHLVLTGNSCHLVPWHAKLGFCNSPSFATLGRLTPDGGVVTIMDLTVVKTHPVAYVEFIEGPDGKTRKSVPRDEKEEMKVQDQWVKRREEMAAKWREDLDKKIRTLEGYAHRLEARAGCSQSKTEDEDPPVHIENYYDDLEETGDINSLLCRLSKFEMRCLSRIIHKNCTALREGASDEMEKDLAFECPPRKIRNFRVVVAKDSRTYKRDAYRKAQITVWDVMDLAFGEGTKAGAFAPNQRFIVTNLIPTQQGAWMGNEPDAEVYLTTRRDSRWTKIS